MRYNEFRVLLGENKQICLKEGFQEMKRTYQPKVRRRKRNHGF